MNNLFTLLLWVCLRLQRRRLKHSCSLQFIVCVIYHFSHFSSNVFLVCAASGVYNNICGTADHRFIPGAVFLPGCCSELAENAICSKCSQNASF